MLYEIKIIKDSNEGTKILKNKICESKESAVEYYKSTFIKIIENGKYSIASNITAIVDHPSMSPAKCVKKVYDLDGTKSYSITLIKNYGDFNKFINIKVNIIEKDICIGEPYLIKYGIAAYTTMMNKTTKKQKYKRFEKLDITENNFIETLKEKVNKDLVSNKKIYKLLEDTIIDNNFNIAGHLAYRIGVQTVVFYFDLISEKEYTEYLL